MFARTERLLLRPGWVEDAPELARAIGEEGIVRNLAGAPWPYSVEDARVFLTCERDPLLPSFLVSLRTRAAPRVIGAAGIARRDDNALELGYWIARPYWGLGFATEAVRAVVSIARATGLVAITAGHFHDNPASGRVLQKTGFRATGAIAKRFSLARGADAPCVLYELAESGGGDVECATDLEAAMRWQTCDICEEIRREEIRLIAA